MKEIQIQFYGSLRDEAVSGREEDSLFRIAGEGPIPVMDLLRMMGISLEKIQVVMVNHRAVRRESVVLPGDRVALFPREYAFFADWKDLRSPCGTEELDG